MNEPQPGGAPQARKPFEIYRGADGLHYAENGIQALVDPSPAVIGAFQRFSDYSESGVEVKLVYARPGFSLTSVWFKSGYPLALHSHTGGCLYHITAGSIRIGDDVLGAGDGFFVDHDVPYTYETGPGGVEVLEFRSTDKLDIRFRGKGQAPWDKIIDKLAARQSDWESEARPSKARPRRTRSTAPVAAPKARRKAARPA